MVLKSVSAKKKGGTRTKPAPGTSKQETQGKEKPRRNSIGGGGGGGSYRESGGEQGKIKRERNSSFSEIKR